LPFKNKEGEIRIIGAIVRTKVTAAEKKSYHLIHFHESKISKDTILKKPHFIRNSAFEW
jgi:hypothetical protein